MNKILDEILHLSEKSLEDPREILKITQEMKKQIEKEDIDSLNQSLSLRQEVINRANITAKKLDEMIEDYDHPQEEKILYYKKQKTQMYGAIYTLEKENQMQAGTLLKDYKGKIKDLYHGKKAINAYGRRPMNQSIMLNKIK